MAFTAHKSQSVARPALLMLLGWAVLFPSSPAIAQSRAAFATKPYIPLAASQNAEQAAPRVLTPIGSATARYKGPPPIVMFRGTPPPLPATYIAAPEPLPIVVDAAIPKVSPARISTNASPLASARGNMGAGWDSASLEPVIAPPAVSDGNVISDGTERDATSTSRLRAYRGPVRRIIEDTGKSITRDLPEAIANALPWVDRPAKNDPFEAVLGRVADDLHRASLADPAWALPVQREIRALSHRLNRLPAPPPLAADSNVISADIGSLDAGDRPFRPRPIWPGASGRPEDQVRPVTLTTVTDQQDGPSTTGVVGRYVPSADDDDGNPPPQANANGPPDRRRPVPLQRPAKSR